LAYLQSNMRTVVVLSDRDGDQRKVDVPVNPLQKQVDWSSLRSSE
jgi:hypothetical protein